MLTTMLLSYVNDSGKPLRRLKCSPHQRQGDRRGTMLGKLMPFHWNQVTWSWLKLTHTGGKEVKDWWEEEPYKVEHQVVEGMPSTS